MYAPLQYLNQAENCFTITNGNRLSLIVNNKFKGLIKNRINNGDREDILIMIVACQQLRGDSCSITEQLEDAFNELRENVLESIGIDIDNPVDMQSVLLCKLTEIEWGQDKRVFKVSNELQNALLNTDVPSKLNVELFKYLPSKAFYVEYADCNMFGENLVGTFVCYEITESAVLLVLNTLYHTGGKANPIHTTFTIPISESNNDLKPDFAVHKTVEVELEFGGSIVFKADKLVKFLFNFFMYLGASNKDVQYVEKKVRNKVKRVNKQAVLKESHLGFSMSTAYSTRKTKIKYVYEGDSKEVNVEKRKLCSHWRNAHWQHYWVKRPDGSKEKVLHWVERIYVKGNYENENVVRVHTVE